MFCTKCGKPLEDGVTVCPDCAAVENEQPAISLEDTFELNLQPEPPVKKKKGGLIALIAAAAVLVAGAVAVILNLDSISNTINETVRSPEDYLTYVEEKGKDAAVEDLTEYYDAYLDNLSRTSYGVTGECHVLLGNKVLDLLKPVLQQANLPADDLTWLSDVLVDIDASMASGKFSGKLGIGLGKNGLLTADVKMDAASGKVWVALPELSSQYLMAETDPMILEGLDLQAGAEMAKALPTSKELEKLIDTYYGIILDGINTVQKSEQTMTVDGISQKFTVLTATLTQEELANIMIAVLEQMKTDTTLETVLDDCCAYLNATEKEYWDTNIKPYLGEEYEPVDMHAELLTAVEDALSEMRAMLDQSKEGNYLTIATYVDNAGTIAGRELKVYGEDVEDLGDIYYITVRDSNKLASELVVDRLKIAGTGTESQGKQNMTYTLTFEDTKYLTLEVKDLVSTAKEASYTLVLKPEQVLLTDVLELDSSVTGVISLMDLSLEISCQTKGMTESTVAIRALTGSNLLAGITMDAKLKDAESFSAPTNTVDAANEQALVQWVKGMKFETLVNNLKTAGVPDFYVQVVQSAADTLMQLLGMGTV